MNVREGVRRVFFIGATVAALVAALSMKSHYPTEYDQDEFWASVIKTRLSHEPQQWTPNAKLIAQHCSQPTEMLRATCTDYKSQREGLAWRQVEAAGGIALGAAITWGFVWLLWWLLDWVIKGFYQPLARPPNAPRSSERTPAPPQD